MSVVPMKMLTVTGPAASIDDIICTCLVNEQFHPVEASHVTKSGNLIPFAWNNPWQEPLARVERLLDDMEIAPDFRDFRGETLDLPTVTARLDEISAELSEYSAQKQALQSRIQENTADISNLEKFAQLPSSLEDLYHLNYVRFRFGRVPRETYDSLTLKMAQQDAVLLYPTQLEEDYAYLVYAAPKDYAKKADNFMISLGFERIRLTSHTLGTPEQTAKMLEEDTQKCQSELETLDASYKQWTAQTQENLLMLYSYLRFMYGAGEVKKFAVYSDETTFMLCGWVPAKEIPRIETRFQVFPDAMLSEDSPKSVKGESPPVLLKNNFWARLFQPFMEMYGLPAYNEFDPTFLMAITFSIMFGMMYGDVGQGIVLIILGVLLYKLRGSWLGGILGSVGIFSVIFGFVFGSFFGYDDLLPGFHVLESGSNATRILIISAVIGVVMIAFMIIINIINGIRQRDFKKVFFTNNSLAGLVLYLGVVIGAVVALMTDIKIFNVAYILLLIVLPLLVLFCQEPLGKLVNHQKDWMPESVGSFIAESFFELFEVVLSYVTNTVSFLRIGAYAICHAGMMMVVYTLAGDPPSILVLVIGNLIVMAIEGLLVMIQVLRLEFYEMFGRFYESGGKKFNPCIIDCTKKIDL